MATFSRIDVGTLSNLNQLTFTQICVGTLSYLLQSHFSDCLISRDVPDAMSDTVRDSNSLALYGSVAAQIISTDKIR